MRELGKNINKAKDKGMEGSGYIQRRDECTSSMANSTCSCPSRDCACWAKISRITAVRSNT